MIEKNIKEEILGNEKKHAEIIKLCKKITNTVFEANAEKLFTNVVAPQCSLLIVSFRNKLIFLNPNQKKELTALSDKEVYIKIVRPISLKIIERGAKRDH
ncbi:MAG: hypothetical protein WC523_03100 [Patescibacteria group bacterium]